MSRYLRQGIRYFQKEQRLNARIGYKKDVTNLLNDASSSDEIKANLLEEVRKTKSLIKKVRILLISEDVGGKEVGAYLKEELDGLFNSLNRKNFRRTFQDFYILWYIISPITLEMLKMHRHQIRQDVGELISFSKKYS